MSSVNPADKTITLFLDGGSQSVFKDMTNAKVPLAVDKKLLANTTTPDEFKKSGAYVVVFYFGGDTRTAVALRPLGPGPFTALTGTVERIDGHRSISVEDKAGSVETFKLGPDTVAEGGSGAVNGTKFQAGKGDRVRIVGTSKDGSPIALFVTEM